jgi:membrane-anchored protein YejM (alkaline phosphatase superfamily)
LKFLLSALLVFCLALPACDSSNRQEHIVLITLDTLRRDHIGAYGSQRQLTTNIDRISDRGLIYDSAFTTMPTTAPAHASLLTGLEPFQHGIRRNGSPLPAIWKDRELATLLRQAGYTTGAFVTSAVLSEGYSGFGGFDRYDQPRTARGQRSGLEAVDAALRWLDEDRGERPVFLWVHLYDPHSPYGDAEQKEREHRVDPKTYGFVGGTRFDDAGQERMARLYSEGVREADQALGVLLSGAAERLGEFVTVIVSDHGETLGEHLETRGYGYDHGEFLDPAEIEIALILAGPGIVPGRTLATASIRDLYTTILEISGVGDLEARENGRRDLRHPSDAPRMVAIERRPISPGEGRRATKAARRALIQHAMAMTDGKRTTLVGSDGTISPVQPGTPELQAAGRLRWSQIQAEQPVRQTTGELDETTRRTLEALGYGTSGPR